MEVPERVTLEGDNIQVSPVLGDTESERAIVPANPPALWTVIVDVPVAPARFVRLVGLADTAKLGVGATLYTTNIACDSVPLVPETFTWNVPGYEKVHESIESPAPVTLVGPIAHTVLFVARFTMPLNPFSEFTVVVDEPDEPAFTVTVAGLDVRAKSWTL